MQPLNEAEAERLSSDQAADLVRVLDLQAEWENHRDDPTKSASSMQDLRIRQKAFEAFRTALRGYSAKYSSVSLPEVTQTVRLVIWCRVLRAVFLKANGSGNSLNAMHSMTRVFRLVDRLASRLGIEPVQRGNAKDLLEAIRELDAVIAWCDDLASSARRDKLQPSLSANAIAYSGIDGHAAIRSVG